MLCPQENPVLLTRLPFLYGRVALRKEAVIGPRSTKQLCSMHVCMYVCRGCTPGDDEKHGKVIVSFFPSGDGNHLKIRYRKASKCVFVQRGT